MNVAITGNAIPIKNQGQGFLPSRLASRAVINGTDKRRNKPKRIISSPIHVMLQIKYKDNTFTRLGKFGD